VADSDRFICRSTAGKNGRDFGSLMRCRCLILAIGRNVKMPDIHVSRTHTYSVFEVRGDFEFEIREMCLCMCTSCINSFYLVRSYSAYLITLHCVHLQHLILLAGLDNKAIAHSSGTYQSFPTLTITSRVCLTSLLTVLSEGTRI
jgi:hypothetical protein